MNWKRQLLALNVALLLLISLTATAFAAVLTMNEPLTYSLGRSNNSIKHTYTPEQTGVYVFHVEALNEVSCGNLILLDGHTSVDVTSKPDNWDYTGCRYTATLEAGKTYTINHQRGSDPGEFRLSVSYGPYTLLPLNQTLNVPARGEEENIKYLFSPEADGWYTFTTNVDGSLVILDDGVPTIEYTYAGNHSKYMLAGKYYNLELRADDATATGTIRASLASFPTISSGVDFSLLLAEYAKGYVSFTPELSGSYTITTQCTEIPYQLEIYSVNGEQLLCSTGNDSTVVNFYYTAGVTYYIAIEYISDYNHPVEGAFNCTVRVHPSDTPYNPFIHLKM